jgi:hypothetical protein
MNPPPHGCDRPLTGHTHDLREGKGGAGLKKGGQGDSSSEWNQKITARPHSNFVNKDLGGRWQDQPRASIDQHKRKAQKQRAPMSPQENLGLGPDASPVKRTLFR